MPDKSTIQRARRKRKQGRSPSTQAGEFVRTARHRAAMKAARTRQRRRAA